MSGAQASMPTSLSGGGATPPLARAGWIAVALATVGLYVYAIPTMYHQAKIGCQDVRMCANTGLLTPSQVAQLPAEGVSLSTAAMITVAQAVAVMLVFAALATLLFWRRADDPMALLCAYMLILFGADLGGAIQTISATSAAWFIALTTFEIAGQISWITFFCLFPDGRFVPGWTRLVALFWAVLWLGAYFPDAPALQPLAALRNGPVAIVFILGALVLAQIYRYRRVSNARQRQQTKWVVYGFAVGMGLFATLVFVGGAVLDQSATEGPAGQLTINAIFLILFSLVPLTMSIAILRARLYDIDIIIQRTLVYGSLTAVLSSVYLLGVVGAQALLSGITGQVGEQRPLVIVVTTLVIAALFQPLRRLLQRAIDRRFYRGKYDAERTLASFGALLRSEVDLEHLSERLTAVVDETMRPAHISLWLQHADARAPHPASEA
ncbi:MAG TPA: hypothetical protein VFQ25_14960 [Ktedonobacterales bacterium]|nr:hypothetical protein [Ktedonobacterales bacterium]